MILNAFLFCFASAPVFGVFLSGAQTPIELDIALGIAVLALLARAIRLQRGLEANWFDGLLVIAGSSLAYACAWMSLTRHSVLWTAPLFILPLALAALLSLRFADSMPKPRGLAQSVLFAAAALLVMVLFSLAIPSPADRHVGALALAPAAIAAAAVLFSLRTARTPAGSLCHWLILSLVVSAAVWTQNIAAWSLWRQAGAEARGWTPHLYQEKENIDYARRAPLRAWLQYWLTAEAIDPRSRIAWQRNWNQLAYLRMTGQVERLGRADALHVLLSQIPPEHQHEAVRNALTPDFYRRALAFEPDIPSQRRIWVDLEWNEDDGCFYLLDRWGGVVSSDGVNIEAVWRPDTWFDDAIDLELAYGGFAILRQTRDIVSNLELDWLNSDQLAPFTFPAPVIDLEFIRGVDGALVISAKGEIGLLGSAPAEFPSWGEMYFESDVIRDFEFDIDHRGYYLLDQYGAIHGNHMDGATQLPYTPPDVPPALVPYWQGQDMAIDLNVDSMGRGLNLMTRQGEVFTITPSPYRETYRPANANPHFAAAMVQNASSELFLLQSNGRTAPLPGDIE